MRTIRSNWRWNTVMFFLQALAFGASVIFAPGSFGTAVGFMTFSTVFFGIVAFLNTAGGGIKKAIAYAVMGNLFGGTGIMSVVAALMFPENLYLWISASTLFFCAILAFIAAFVVAADEASAFPWWVAVAPLLPLGVGTTVGGIIILYYRKMAREMRGASTTPAKEKEA